MKEMSQRQLRISEMISHEVAKTVKLCNFADPSLSSMVNICGAWVSPDLKHTRIFFSTLIPQEKTVVKDIAAMLNAERHIFQKQLSQIGLKFTPRVKFYYDDFYEKEDRITSILHDDENSRHQA